jgi:hypothetical protein
MLLSPRLAFACATCFDPKEASQGAFVGGTIFMSLLPLAMMGAIGGFVWYRARVARN